MALVKCRECGHEVSTEAAACPNCGYPIKQQQPQQSQQLPWMAPSQTKPTETTTAKKGIGCGGMIAVAFIFFVFLVVIAGLFDNDSENDKFTSETNTLTKSNGISSAEMANVEHGKQVYDKLNTKYSDIMNPIIAGLATSTPVLRICVPDTEWVKLANKDKVDLTYYLESLIPAVRNNPEPYITISPNAPIYDTFLSRAKSLCNDCWAIMECSWNTERKSWSLDRTFVQGDTPWYKDDPCCRGVSASELLRTQSSTLSCPQGYSLEYNPPKGVWECIQECQGLLSLDANDNWKCDGVLAQTVSPNEEFKKTVEPYSEAETKPTPTNIPDEWNIYETISPIDNSPTVILALEAENEVKGWLDTHTLVLYIRCKENKTEIYIETGMPANVEYGLYNEHSVRIRLDDNKAFSEHWVQSTDNEALFAPKAIPLARKIVKAKTMLFEFTPFNSNPATVNFDVRGLEKHLRKVAETCHWTF